jgi:hypothetical protein
MVLPVAEYCRNSAYDIAAKAYPPGGDHFANHQYDSLIEDALRELALRG